MMASTVILKIFVAVNNLQLKENTKIKNSKILFQQIFTTANIYGLLKPTNNRLATTIIKRTIVAWKIPELR